MRLLVFQYLECSMPVYLIFDLNLKIMLGEISMLKAYAEALQRQNQAKNKEQLILYRQFQAMKSQLVDLEQYYYRSRQSSKEILSLKAELKLKHQDYQHAVTSLNKNQEASLKNYKLQQELRENSKIIFELKEKLAEALAREKQLCKQMEINELNLAEQQTKNNELIEVLNHKQNHIETLSKSLQQLQRKDVNISQALLLKSYQHVEQTLYLKQKRISEMQDYISDLQESCEEINHQLLRMQAKEKKSQGYIKRLNARIQEMSDGPQQMNKKLTPFTKLQGLGQRTERMVLNSSEKENSSIISNMGHSERLVVSECANDQHLKTSPNRLKLRVATLKLQNQSLLKQIST